MPKTPPHTPIKPSPLSQPTLAPKAPDDDDDNNGNGGGRYGSFWAFFFNTDNPLWTLFPILLSVAALWFAYKSNVINREWADVHIRLTSQAMMGYRVESDPYFMVDDDFYLESHMGSLENIDELMDTVTLANNDMSMRWISESIGIDPEDVSIDDVPYSQYFIFLALANDGDQIAEKLYIKFDHYKVEDNEAFRGDEKFPEVEPEEWEYGPMVLAPDQWIIIPMGSCFLRLDPISNDPEVQYFGDFYNPLEMTYYSAVSGDHTVELNLDDIPQTMNAFREPGYVEEEPGAASGDGIEQK